MSETKSSLKDIGNVNIYNKANAKSVMKSKTGNSSKKPMAIYRDKPEVQDQYTQTETASVNVAIQTDNRDELVTFGASFDLQNDSGVGVGDLDQEAFDMMVREPIPENYWRDLAEERRLSLAEALAENEMLNQSIEELKGDNQNLSLLASEADYLATFLNEVLGKEVRNSSATYFNKEDSCTEFSSNDLDSITR